MRGRGEDQRRVSRSRHQRLVATLTPAANDTHVARFASLGTRRFFESDLLALAQRLETVADDIGEVNKEVVALVVTREAEALGVIEETHDCLVVARSRGARARRKPRVVARLSLTGTSFIASCPLGARTLSHALLGTRALDKPSFVCSTLDARSLSETALTAWTSQRACSTLAAVALRTGGSGHTLGEWSLSSFEGTRSAFDVRRALGSSFRTPVVKSLSGDRVVDRAESNGDGIFTSVDD